MMTSRTFTRREIESLIAAGDIIVIADSNVLRLNGWKNSHPGGELVLRHMVGRDATDEINMCVPGLFYIPPALSDFRKGADARPFMQPSRLICNSRC